MSKGHWRRPSQVSKQEYDNSHDRIFGPKPERRERPNRGALGDPIPMAPEWVQPAQPDQPPPDDLEDFLALRKRGSEAMKRSLERRRKPR